MKQNSDIFVYRNLTWLNLRKINYLMNNVGKTENHLEKNCRISSSSFCIEINLNASRFLTIRNKAASIMEKIPLNIFMM